MLGYNGPMFGSADHVILERFTVLLTDDLL